MPLLSVGCPFPPDPHFMGCGTWCGVTWTVDSVGDLGCRCKEGDSQLGVTETLPES